jgi:mono/diheme cytochrome c family protein
MDLVFFPGTRPSQPEPLGAFLPPLMQGVAGEFLRRYAGQRRVVIDPFGQSPALALELAREGASLLVGCLNPVVRALIQLQAQPPSADALRGTLAKLASAKRSGPAAPGPSRPGSAGPRPAERLEDHLRSLYLVTCSACHATTEAEAYVWSRETGREAGAGVPERDKLVSRIYTCSQCNHQAEEDATPEDEEVARPYLTRGIYYHLALERLAPPDHPDRVHAEEALEVYPLRALYALFSILVRVETLDLSADEKRASEALLITALDEAHILRGYAPQVRQRPRSLQAPARYKEVNVWRVLQRAVELWSAEREHVAVRAWRPGDALEPHAISLFAGSARELAADLAPVAADCVISALPRPNQALWTLSAAWAGWLWGPAAVAPLRGVLHRRRYDWAWHANALLASAESFSPRLASGLPFVGLLGESEPGLMAAALWAFDRAGFELEGRALRADTDAAQIVWRGAGRRELLGPTPELANLDAAVQIARQAAYQVILDRSEPTAWEVIHAAAWSQVALGHLFPTPSGEAETDFTHCQAGINEAAESHPQVAAAKGEDSDLGSTWWMHDPGAASIPLADRVEAEVGRILAEHAPIDYPRLDQMVCETFPGLLTPETRLVRACVRSYGTEDETQGLWSLRPEDNAEQRAADLEAVRAALIRLGERFGFRLSGVNPLEFRDSGRTPRYQFYLITSAAFGRYLLDPRLDPERAWVVLPGGRVSLVEYKMRRNWLLRQAVENGWRFLKFRHVRRMLDDALLTRETLDQRLGLDPLGNPGDQIAFI